MGGYGSGRKLDAKSVTSTYLCIDARHLKKQGALEPGCEFTLRFEANNAEVAGEAEQTVVWFSYSIRKDDDYEEQLYRVPLSFTPAQFNGERMWFLCPNMHCGKRVAKLYIAHRLGCRHCLKLSHQSKNESHMDRMARRADKLRVKLGWQEGILNPEGFRPKGMHLKTFERLVKRYRELRNIAIISIAEEVPALHHLIRK
jgi:hypothetical protein